MFRSPLGLAAILASLLLSTPLRAQDKWALPDYGMRFKATITSEPSSPEAGIIAILPNGGALPGPFPVASVVDSTGQQLRTECVWNNPQEGFGIVFTPPANSDPVWIYVQGASTPLNPWTPDSPLHPSLLLYTRTGHGSLEDAEDMGQQNPPGEGVRMGLVPMIADNQNRFGPSDNFSSYYTGWINIPETGSIFIGTISDDGSTVLLDGKEAASWPGLHGPREGQTGKKGTQVSVTKGLHRIQYFQFFNEGYPLAQLIWHLSWMKTPLPQTPNSTDFAQSGSVSIMAGESRAGAPPALFDRRAISYMNFADQFVDLFEFTVPLSDQYRGATFDWSFSDGSHGQGSRLLWPVLRGLPLSVTLTVTANGGKSSSTRPIYPDTLPPGAKVDNLSDRRDYAQALLNRLQGAPAGTDPTATWPPSFWQILPQVVEGGEAEELLSFLFQHCAATMSTSISADDLRRLGDIYYDELKENKSTAIQILQNIIAAQKDPAARFHWQLKALDFELYEMGDIDTARRIATGLQPDAFAGGSGDAEAKLIAEGDVERMAGNVNAATQYYTNAQAAYQQSQRTAFQGFTGFSEPTVTRPSGNGMVISAATNQDADWRKRIVVQNSYFTEVKNLIDQGRLDDAREKLDTWALEFPLAKMSGDYTLASAEYALAFDDYARAERILKAYRHRVDLSPELAEVMQQEWDCDAELQNVEDIKDLATDIKKRFPDLPLAKDADKALHGQMPEALVGRRLLQRGNQQ